MIRKFRKFIPHFLVNYSKHLPEAVLANFKYGFPGKKLRVIGVTGTDGKTTTVNMIYRILKDAGKSVSMISTINAYIGNKSYETGFHVTSPDPKDIQRYLKLAVDNCDEFMVLEVTSHALEQFRVWGIPFEVGVITNITHEHLDYHKTWENYFKAKVKLIKNVKYAVLNYDDPSYDKQKKVTAAKVITFGKSKKADFNPETFQLKLKISGDFNILNALAAAAVGKIFAISNAEIKKSLENFLGLKGRMEEVKNDLGIKIIIDFAHTPNALKQALKTLKPLTKRKLISVFGCAGDRDITKRPVMGAISVQQADITILTAEDPRFEDIDNITNQIAQGALKVGALWSNNLFKENDRGKAIKMAVEMAERGDTIVIFGKGHEKSMNYQGVEKNWSDQEAVKKVISHG